MNNPALSAISLASPNCNACLDVSPNATNGSRHTNGFKHPWSTLGMPTLDIASELLASIEDTIIIILVVEGPSEGIAKHALC